MSSNMSATAAASGTSSTISNYSGRIRASSASSSMISYLDLGDSAMENSSSSEISRHRLARQASSAATSVSDENLDGYVYEKWAFRDSIEIVRDFRDAQEHGLALENYRGRDSLDFLRERCGRFACANAREKADSDAATLMDSDYELQLQLQGWAPLHSAGHQATPGRRALQHAQETSQRATAKARSLNGRLRSAVGKVFCSCFPRCAEHDPADISVNGRPILLLRHTGHKMTADDHQAWEHGTTRIRHLNNKAKADGWSNVAAWCRREGVRY